MAKQLRLNSANQVDSGNAAQSNSAIRNVAGRRMDEFLRAGLGDLFLSKEQACEIWRNAMEEFEPSRNVFGGMLETCSDSPKTGFFRNGCCDTGRSDAGSHTVCVVVNDEFLAFSKYVGNDLSTPNPRFGFLGLKPGDQWCLCAGRFLQAHEEGLAPKVLLRSTHHRALDIVPLEVLKKHAIDLQ